MRNTTTERLTESDIAPRLLDIVSEQLGVRRSELHLELRLIEDLRCDSLDVVELFMEIEDEFNIALPDNSPNPVYKKVFTRTPFRLADFVELIYLQQGTAPIAKRSRWRSEASAEADYDAPFTQLGGRLDNSFYRADGLYEPLSENAQGFKSFRRRTDGMTCVRVPSAEVTLGSDSPAAMDDERPTRRAQIDGFVIDAEPVSTTAYARFLNSIGPVDGRTLTSWFQLTPDDHRHKHALLHRKADEWQPVPGAELFPMVLVSWYGASAYSLWANRQDWSAYAERSLLPSEAQWEYAARGAEPRMYPWGDDEPTAQRMRFAQHARGAVYAPRELPLAAVNQSLGMSPFGLNHMAGNVWHWCADWYDPSFPQRPEASDANPFNTTTTGIRSERGGSWIGSPLLCRSSYRRGRIPAAKGRCLGFRCISADVSSKLF